MAGNCRMTKLATPFDTIGKVGPGESPEQICARVFREIRPRTPMPEIQIEFRRFANANSFIRLRNGRLELRVSDLFQDAPGQVFESLAVILVSKLYRRQIPPEHSHRYRRYLNRRDVRQTMDTVRQQRGRKLIAPAKGDVYDLEQIFEEINFQYFFGLMSRPVIGWSQKVSRSTLGHYDAPHNTIVLSKVLDRPTVPRIAVEYVMFHEMLHMRHPVEHIGSRRCVHTPDFKRAEKEFRQLAEAKSALRKL